MEIDKDIDIKTTILLIIFWIPILIIVSLFEAYHFVSRRVDKPIPYDKAKVYIDDDTIKELMYKIVNTDKRNIVIAGVEYCGESVLLKHIREISSNNTIEVSGRSKGNNTELIEDIVFESTMVKLTGSNSTVVLREAQGLKGITEDLIGIQRESYENIIISLEEYSTEFKRLKELIVTQDIVGINPIVIKVTQNSNKRYKIEIDDGKGEVLKGKFKVGVGA